MNVRWMIGLCAASLLVLACGSGESTEEPESVAPEEMSPIAGMYEVSGVTVDKESGRKREISGKVILADDGDDYTATFNLSTTFPGGGDPIAAEVIGKGDGQISGRTLNGKAETQLVVATVPGVDPGFAFIPRTVSTRIVSTSVATVAADGSVQIEIESEPAPGEEYRPTRTTLRGRRVSAAGLGGEERAKAPAENATP